MTLFSDFEHLVQSTSNFEKNPCLKKRIFPMHLAQAQEIRVITEQVQNEVAPQQPQGPPPAPEGPPRKILTYIKHNIESV